MPELPEVEITARRIGAALAGATVESALSPSVNALRTFDPPLSALEGRTIQGVVRRGKLFMVQFEGELTALLHLMSAGRLQLYDKRAGLRDRTSRLLVRITDGRELRLREFGTKQAAWVKLYRPEGLAQEEMLTTLGPEAWPEPPDDLRPLFKSARPLHGVLRDQRVIAGIGRSWVDEILHEAMLSPFKRGSELTEDEADPAAGRDHRPARLRPGPLRADDHAADPRQAADAAAGAPPQRRAVLALRRHDRGGLLRGLRDVLLPDRPDRRQAAQGPPAFAAAQVAAK